MNVSSGDGPRRAAIYTRISADLNGDALGVQRQEEDARKLCAARGWEVVEVFCDNDRSAYSQRKPRPAYQAMLDAVRAGRIDVIVAWHPDRLHRRLRELVPFIDLINEHGVQVETVTAGRYDLSTPTGRMHARIVGSVAEYESEHKAERIRRKLEQNAVDGREHGGSRPYGWSRDRKSIVPEEAAAVREATARILAGESIKSVARALNDAGYRTATGRPWRDVTVRDMLLRPRNAGLRIHHGQVVGRGEWEPIISVEDFHQVEAILKNPARRTNPVGGGRKYLLSTVARCGVCDGPIVAGRSKPYKGKSRVIYRCQYGSHVSRIQERADEVVTKLILCRLSRPDARELLAEPDQVDRAREAAARVAELQDRLKSAAEAYAAGAITLAQLTTINGALRPLLDKAQAEAASPSRAQMLGEIVTQDPREVWKRLKPEQRRAVVDLLMTVRILPTRPGPGFDPASVEITWKV